MYCEWKDPLDPTSVCIYCAQPSAEPIRPYTKRCPRKKQASESLVIETQITHRGRITAKVTPPRKIELEGVGTEVSKLFQSSGFDYFEGCPCTSRILAMNEWGRECLDKLLIIEGWFTEAAIAAGKPAPGADITRMIVEQAWENHVVNLAAKETSSGH